MKKEKVVVVFSGGLDSTTLLYWAKKHYQDVEALTFNYGSKHNEKEIHFAKEHCLALGVKHQIINLNLNEWGFTSSLLKDGEKIPEGHYAAENMKSTVVPFRNGIMLSIAVGYAENIKADRVLLGSHSGDHDIYPDCRREFTLAISLAASLGTYNNVKIESPFNDMKKEDIVKEGKDLKVLYDRTWSCYEGGDRPCLKCGTCVERTEAFFLNEVKDPSLTNEEWEEAKSVLMEIL